MPSSTERAVVTGASGFIGAQLVRRLLASGSEVVAVVRPGSDLWRLDGVLGEIELIEADVATLGDGESRRIERADVVHHLAAAGVTAAGDEAELVQTNVFGTLRVLELAGATGARRLVYGGSCFEYGAGASLPENAPPAPRSPYAATKAAAGLLARALARANGVEVVWLRPFTVYGPYEAAARLVPSTILGALAGVPVRLTRGDQQRDFVFVEDVASAFAAAGEVPLPEGGVFNVCTGRATAVKDVAAAIARLHGGAKLELGAIPERETDTPVLAGDPAHAAAVLGWQAETALADGLRATLEWFGENRHLYERLAAGAR